ncbi:unnamed protein product [Arctogadus glacialis]
MNRRNIIPDLHVKFGEKTWNETFLLVRRCMEKVRDKTKPCEPVVRCLEKFRALNVFSLNAMMSHLEKIAQQRGMGFHFSEATCYLTADLFYLEVALSLQGGVQDVKVAPHGQPPMSNESLLVLLRSKNFVAFSKKLEGFAALYNVPGNESEDKIKLFTSLQYLGKDLLKISRLPRHIKDYNTRVDTILNGRTGYLTEGKEDCPLTIQFYVSPSDVLKASSSIVWDMEEVGQVGQVMVGLSDVVHVLQMASLLPVPPQLDTQGNPVFMPLSEIPSESFPACFVLRLHPPLPMFSSFLTKIGKMTEVAVPDVDLQWAPFHTILMKGLSDSSSGDEALDQADREFKVSLPGDLQHRYVLPAAAWALPALRGTVVGSLPFSRPGHVPDLLEVLRHQCAINTLLASCLAPQTAGPRGSGVDLVFEILMQSETSLAVTFQRPDVDSLAILVVEIPLSGELSCSLFTAGTREVSLEEYTCRVINRCMSIPVTMRALCAKLEKISSSSSSSSSSVPPPPDPLHTQTGGDGVTPCPTPSSSETLLASLPPHYNSHNALVPEDEHPVYGSDYFTGPTSTPEQVAEVPMTTSPCDASDAPMGEYSHWMSTDCPIAELM